MKDSYYSFLAVNALVGEVDDVFRHLQRRWTMNGMEWQNTLEDGMHLWGRLALAEKLLNTVDITETTKQLYRDISEQKTKLQPYLPKNISLAEIPVQKQKKSIGELCGMNPINKDK